MILSDQTLRLRMTLRSEHIRMREMTAYVARARTTRPSPRIFYDPLDRHPLCKRPVCAILQRFGIATSTLIKSWSTP